MPSNHLIKLTKRSVGAVNWRSMSLSEDEKVEIVRTVNPAHGGQRLRAEAPTQVVGERATPNATIPHI